MVLEESVMIPKLQKYHLGCNEEQVTEVAHWSKEHLQWGQVWIGGSCWVLNAQDTQVEMSKRQWDKWVQGAKVRSGIQMCKARDIGCLWNYRHE